MQNINRELLAELKSGLVHIYGSQIKGVYLYGSYARGDQESESDLDILIVLDRFEHYGDEIDRTSELISQLSLKHSVSVSTIFIREQEWSKGDTPLLRNIREEAILA